MLKFEFDEEKQKIFLTFWKIKNLSQFKGIIATPKQFFLRLCLLEEMPLKTLGLLIKEKFIPQLTDEYILNTFKRPENHTSPDLLPQFSLLEIDNLKEILEMLDSINIINLWGKNSKHHAKEGTEGKFMHPLNTTSRTNSRNREVSSGQLENLLDNCSFTKEFEEFFIQFFKSNRHSINNIEKNISSATNYQTTLNNISSLSPKSKKIFKNFSEYHGFIGSHILPHHPEEELLGLEQLRLIDFNFLPESFLPVVTLSANAAQATFNSSLGTTNTKKTSKTSSTEEILGRPTPIPFPCEDLAEALFFLQVATFEDLTQTNLGKFYPPSTTGITKKKFLTDIFNALVEKKELTVYQNLNFYQKIELLLKNYLPQSYQLIKVLDYNNLSDEADNFLHFIFPLIFSLDLRVELAQGIGEDKFLYLCALLFFMAQTKKRIFKDPNQFESNPFTPLDKIQILHALEPLLNLGLVVKKKNIYYFQIAVIEKLFKTSTSTPHRSNSFHPLLPTSLNSAAIARAQIVIDSDYSIIATKEYLDAEEIFFLYHFCKLNISAHLIRGSLDTELSSLAWFYRCKAKHLVNFFSVRAEATLTKNFQNVLELYFEHCPYFAQTKIIKVTTESKNFFLVFKYFLETHELTKGVTILDEEKTIIFHDLKHYEKVFALFPDTTPIKILPNFTSDSHEVETKTNGTASELTDHT